MASANASAPARIDIIEAIIQPIGRAQLGALPAAIRLREEHGREDYEKPSLFHETRLFHQNCRGLSAQWPGDF
ncbi:hypothetical protein FOZG_17276 [Fusarium oxysporum Fo47]|uniref:Uncharacterized protein n=1 Tax=Fusarium oxysporum Fo47 TaxID=660027 RepID=W9JA90_FUSOX|nr:hypothetical protein FOZG_17276 [Fusarium oxysporum Fo47]